MNFRIATTTSVLAAGLAACGGGEGTVSVTAYGESFIEDGIPAAEVADGWSVSFSRFNASIVDIEVAGQQLANPATIDVSQGSNGEGHVLGAMLVPSGEHEGSAYTVERLEVVGSAEKDGTTKTFNWVFDQSTRYSACETVTDVPDAGSATFQITLHADHLLYDSVVAEEPGVLFQALADADTDADGEITQAELMATGIGSYDPGSDGSIDNLWSYLIALTRTVGHVDGEGHCDASAI